MLDDTHYRRPQRKPTVADVLAGVYAIIAVIVGVTWPVWALLMVFK